MRKKNKEGKWQVLGIFVIMLSAILWDRHVWELYFVAGCCVSITEHLQSWLPYHQDTTLLHSWRLQSCAPEFPEGSEVHSSTLWELTFSNRKQTLINVEMAGPTLDLFYALELMGFLIDKQKKHFIYKLVIYIKFFFSGQVVVVCL